VKEVKGGCGVGIVTGEKGGSVGDWGRDQRGVGRGRCL